MYYIYHIPNVKIGCTVQQPKKRVKEQGYTSFEILEKHSCIDKASIRERELQLEYGYPTDSGLYKNHYFRMKKIRKPWSKEVSNRGRETMRKNGFYKDFHKIGNKARIKSCLMIDKDTNKVLKEFDSISEAGRYLGEKML